MALPKKEFERRFEEGTLEEHELVAYLQTAVDANDQEYLNAVGLTIADILNGRYTVQHEYTVMAMAKKWNDKLGYKILSI